MDDDIYDSNWPKTDPPGDGFTPSPHEDYGGTKWHSFGMVLGTGTLYVELVAAAPQFQGGIYSRKPGSLAQDGVTDGQKWTPIPASPASRAPGSSGS